MSVVKRNYDLGGMETVLDRIYLLVVESARVKCIAARRNVIPERNSVKVLRAPTGHAHC